MSEQARRHSGPGTLVKTYAWLILCVTLLTVTVAMAFAVLQPATYTSSSRVLVGRDVSGGTALEPDMGTEREIAMSGSVTSVAAEELGISEQEAHDSLSVTVPVETTVLEIAYRAHTAEAAQEGVRAFAHAYVSYRSEGRRAIGDARAPTVITSASLPSRPDATNYPVVLTVSLMVGLALGFGAALLSDRATDRLRSVDDIRARATVPVLARVPGRFGPTEAFSYLATQLPGVLGSRRGLTILVTSPSPGAGKTTVAAELARTLAALGKEVVLVGADLRRPAVHRQFGRENTPGLSDVLVGRSGLEQALRTTLVPGLRLLAAGTQAPGPVHLPVEDLHVTLGRLASSALVVIDAPTVLEAAEVAQLADRADQILLVVDLRQGRRGDIEEAEARLGVARPKLVGIVANDPQHPRRRQARQHGQRAVSATPSEAPAASATTDR